MGEGQRAEANGRTLKKVSSCLLMEVHDSASRSVILNVEDMSWVSLGCSSGHRREYPSSVFMSALAITAKAAVFSGDNDVFLGREPFPR